MENLFFNFDDLHHLGKNSIIGAKSLVNKDIPENVIAAGVPCKILRKRK